MAQRRPMRLDEDHKRLMAAILELTLHERRHEHGLGSRPGLGLGRTLHAHGLGTRHTTALLTIALHGPMSVTQLAMRHGVLVKTASLMAVELEQTGLIERREDPADRRRTILTIAKGKERAVEQGLSRRAAHLQRTLERLTPPQREGLITGLQVLAEEIARDHS